MIGPRSQLSEHRMPPDDDRHPRLHIPVIATLVGTLAVVNVASAILAMIN